MDVLQGVLVVAVLSAGLVAGVFLTFSDFIMRSLGRAEGVAGIEAMQVINREIYRSWFVALLMGLSVVSIGFVGLGLWIGGAVGGWMGLGGAAYVLGVMVVTGRANVPMNHRLDQGDKHRPETQAFWRHYLRRWTRWNHLRTVASVVSAGAYLGAALAI